MTSSRYATRHLKIPHERRSYFTTTAKPWVGNWEVPWVTSWEFTVPVPFPNGIYIAIDIVKTSPKLILIS